MFLGLGLGQATVVNNTLSINIDDLAKVLQSAKTDPAEIGRHVALQIERSGSSKRKQAGEDEEPDEESPLLIEQTFEVCDNGHDVLSWPVRLALSPINRDPSDVWTKETYPRVKHPILGGTMYMEHLMPGEVNHATLKLRHDRGYLLTVNQFIRRNASIFQRSSKKVQVSNKDGKGMVLHTNKHWEPCRGVYEVVEGFLNYVATEHCIRPHSHEALVILRVLHELRWLANVSKKGVSQGRQLEELIQYLWHLNSVRGVQQKAPLSYTECKRHALEHLGPSLQRKIGQDEQGVLTFIVWSLILYFYTSAKQEELSRLQQENKELRAKVKDLSMARKAQPPRVQDTRRTGPTYRNADVCKKFNESKDGCQATACPRVHKCSKLLKPNFWCWNRDHGESVHV